MGQRDSRSHYDSLATSYNENWEYSREFLSWMSGHILRRLDMHSGDRVADVGCGTGLYSRGVAERAGSVVCVDPSPKMLEQLPDDAAYLPIQASAEDLVHGRAQLPHDRLDAILVKEAIHHVDRIGEVVRGLAGLLLPRGRLLVVMLPTTIHYPLFTKALELFERLQPDPRDVAHAMEAAGLRVELDYESFPLSFSKERYLRMVADRYMSLLSHFDDEELAEGLTEIDASYDSDPLQFPDRFAFVLGVHP